MEDVMLRHLPICSFICLSAALGSPASGQQQEAVLQAVDVPNVGVTVVVATAKTDAPAVDFRGTPDPTLIYLAGGELVHSYDDKMQALFPTLDTVLSPACMLHVGKGDRPAPVAVYVIPRARTAAAQ
jgi:hypothetical protein